MTSITPLPWFDGDRAMSAMLRMVKIDVAELERVAGGVAELAVELSAD